MNIIFESVTDHQPELSDTQPSSSPLATDFFEARHQLMLPRQDSTTSDKTARAVEIIDWHPQPFRAAPAVAEQALYWLISAPALVYLLYIIFCL
jgi:hypothetical protein